MIEKVKETVRDLNPLSILLETGFDYTRPRRGQFRRGKVVGVEGEGLIVDIGTKAEGLVPAWDLDKLGEVETEDMSPGDEVWVVVTRPGDGVEGITLSVAQARGREDWQRAKRLLGSEEIVEAEVIDHNRGGLLVEFGQLRGFVPASHVDGVRSYRGERQQEKQAEMRGQRLTLVVIDVDQMRNRLVLSERKALQARRERRMDELFEQLSAGDTVSGTVSGLCDFGAFVDLGGANGLIHISELSWSWVKDPSEVVDMGQEVETYVLNLDQERRRIGLSLKQLRPDPWDGVEDRYDVGEVVEGTVASVRDFGAFVELEGGIIGSVHAAELEGPPNSTPHDLVSVGDILTLRILEIDAQRHRMSLSQRQATDRPATASTGSPMAQDGFWDGLAEIVKQEGGES